MLHIYPMCGIFHLPSIDTGTRSHQFNIRTTSSWDFADEGPWKILSSPPGDRARDLQHSRHTGTYYNEFWICVGSYLGLISANEIFQID